MELMLGFLLAMSVTMALIPPLMRAAERLHFLDDPGHRKVHSTPVPRVGGIAMAAGTLLALALAGEFAQPMPAYLAGVVVLLVFGVLDDRYTLSAGPKFAGQIIAALLVMTWGDVQISTTTLVERHELPGWLGQPLTLLFLLGVTNAINLADGLDGLAGGTTLLSLCALALLALTSGSPFVGVVAIVIIGAILGFLRFNTHPARVFMGDGGSQILGFSAAVLAVVLTQDEATPLSSALPLLLLGMPIIDTLMVMSQRLLEGRSPFQADRNHIHHRLLALGFDHHEAVMAIYLLQGSLFVIAWFCRYESDLAILVVFFSIAAASIAVLQAAQRRDWKWRRAAAGGAVPGSRLALALTWLRSTDRLPLWSLAAIAGSACIYLLSLAAVCPGPSADVRVLTAALAGIIASTLFLRRRSAQASWIEKCAIYIALVIAVYFDRQTESLLESVRWAQWTLFVLLAAAVILRFRLATERRLRISPLDVLVIFVAIVIPNLPGSVVSPLASGESIAKLIVLMYGVEALLGAGGYWWRVPLLAALTLMTICAAHGLV